MGTQRSSPSRTLEREVKLDLDVATSLPDLRPVAGTSVGLPTLNLRTVYFDTNDQRLRHLGLSLRHRRGEEDDETWTLKVPSATRHRVVERIELSWTGSADTVPAATAALLMGILRHRDLQPVVELSTTRQRLVLGSPKQGSGPPVALELDDDTVTVVGGAMDGTRFRQLEMEQHREDAGLLDRVVRELLRIGARPTRASKLALALDDAEFAPPTVSRHASLGAVVQVAIADGLERLLRHDIPLRLAHADPSAHDVHQARVATRRLRSHLKTFAPILDPIWVDHTRTELAWLGDLLGAVRDIDVLGTSLDDDAVHEELRKQRTSVVAALAQGMASARYTDLLDRLDAAVAQPPFYDLSTKRSGRAAVVRSDLPARDGLTVLVGREWRSVRRRIREAGRHPSDRELHRIRIATKRLRYAAEMAAPVMGKPARRIASQAEKLQTVLGEHHDAVAAHAWLRACAATVSAPAAFRMGQLAGGQERRQVRLRQDWRQVSQRLNTKKRTAWLR